MEIKKVRENDLVSVFNHFFPISETYLSVIPKNHIISILDPKAKDGTLLSAMAEAVQESTRIPGLDKTGFYVHMNAGSHRVTPHLNWHIMKLEKLPASSKEKQDDRK